MIELIKWFYSNYPDVVKAMKDSDHNYSMELTNPYHIEGDVWTHTMMVCKQIENESQVLRIAALLHDIGKPLVREVKEETKRVRFFSHEPVSAFLSLDITNKLELCDEDRIRVFNLLALHTEPFKLEPEKLARLLVNNRKLLQDLLILSQADSNGRFSDTPFESKNYPCLGKSVVNTNKEVHLMCGLPGSGKSTIAKRIPDSYLVSRDECLMELVDSALTYSEAWEVVDQKDVDRKLQEKFKESKNNNTVVIDMTHMSKKSRRKSLAQYGKDYRRVCHIVIPTMEDVDLRNSTRIGKTIPDEVIGNMIKSFYPPMYDEFDEINYYLD